MHTLNEFGLFYFHDYIYIYNNRTSEMTIGAIVSVCMKYIGREEGGGVTNGL